MLKKIVILMLAMCLLVGCAGKDDKTVKIKDLKFTVLSEDDWPPELKRVIDEKRVQEFKVTYQDSGFLYICRGYGKQVTGGYSIRVNDVYLTKNAIYADTALLGPEPGTVDETKKNSASYPVIVLKMEYVDKAVVFQ